MTDKFEDWLNENLAHSDPEILDGTPVIRGTRMPVEIVLRAQLGEQSNE